MSFPWLPPEASAHAVEIDRLLLLVHLLMALLFVGWSAYFVYCLVRFRAGRQPRADHGGVKSRVGAWVEVGVAVAEAALLIAVAIPVWARRVDQLPPEEDSTVVRVVAQQFAWNIHYPGADGVFGTTRAALAGPGNPVGLDRDDPFAADDVVTINQLNLPVGKPVIIRLSSLDVVHSLFLPQMRVKQDAIPGMEIPLWFLPTRETPEGETWHMACAQLCGNSHYRMRGFYRVTSPEEHAAWLAERSPAAADEP